MKKRIAAFLLAASMVLSLAACAGSDTKPDQTAQSSESTSAQSEPVSSTDAEPQIAGGWTVNSELEKAELDSDSVSVFEKAMKDSKEKLAPVAVLATQVVAGQNLEYLAYDSESSKLKLVVVYKDLSGGASVLDTKELALDETVKNEENEKTDSSADTDASQLNGGWIVNSELKEAKLSDFEQKKFDEATKKLEGKTYQPVILLGTKVVAGEIFAVLCKESDSKLSVVYVSAPVSGEGEIMTAAPLSLGTN